MIIILPVLDFTVDSSTLISIACDLTENPKNDLHDNTQLDVLNDVISIVESYIKKKAINYNEYNDNSSYSSNTKDGRFSYAASNKSTM